MMAESGRDFCTLVAIIKKTPWFWESFERRGWDSNPRYLAVYSLSKRAR